MQREENGLVISESDGHVLTYNDKSHRYKLDDRPCGGVTGNLKKGYPESHFLTGWKISQGSRFAIDEYTKKAAENPKGKVTKKDIEAIIKSSKVAYMKKSQEAADIGSVVHDYIYSYRNNLDFDYTKVSNHPEKEKIERCIEQFMAYQKKNNDEPLGDEQIVASPKHWFAGKFDHLARRQGKIVLSDYKTSSGIFIDMFIQLGLYSIAIEEWLKLKVDAVEILRFGKEGVFEPRFIDDPIDIKNFQLQGIRSVQTAAFRKEYEE